MLSNEDQQLMHLWKSGNREAFNQLFAKYYQPLCWHAFNMIKDQEAAKDVVQQVFTDMLVRKLFKKLDSNIKGYLYAAVQNRCIRILDNRKRHRFHLDRMGLTTPVAEAPDADMKKDETAAKNRALKEVINELPRQRRQAVELFYLEGHKQKEVAEKMGIRLSSVKTHLQLALATLREKLKAPNMLPHS
ncbi:RNA polymerase sigma factor [Chitinophaga lutea]